jgi:hypothetical protein
MLVHARETDKHSHHSYKKWTAGIATASGLVLLLLLFNTAVKLTTIKLHSCKQPSHPLTTPELGASTSGAYRALVNGQERISRSCALLHQPSLQPAARSESEQRAPHVHQPMVAGPNCTLQLDLLGCLHAILKH